MEVVPSLSVQLSWSYVTLSREVEREEMVLFQGFTGYPMSSDLEELVCLLCWYGFSRNRILVIKGSV